ncbi:MAG: pyridoxamine 5'-phosphate oxidase family protein [Betaproteobacteria bacterium]|nr:pyridoxamine 5'-phosphate oxidase family protein [Betaproteobacteria bacterium]
MAKMSQEVQKAVAEIKPGLIATSSKTGKPNVSAKGSLRVLDDEHLMFANIMSPGTLTNLQENPQIAVICLDPATRAGCRIFGRSEILNAGPLFDQMSQEYATKRMTVKQVVKIAVEEAYTFKI